MTIHTTTADANGNFSISLTTPLISGETIEVKAQKDDQSKTIVIQAPSEPYLPNPIEPSTPIIPMNSYFSADILSGNKILYDGKGATSETVGDTTTITNNYFKSNEVIRLYQVAKIDLAYFNNADDSSVVFKIWQGTKENDVIAWDNQQQDVTKSEVKNYLLSLTTPFTIDENYVYLVLINSIYYVNGSDQADNITWKVECQNQTHIYLTNKNYTANP